MPIIKQTTTIYKCDFCNHEYEDETSVCANVSMRITVTAYDGAKGGSSQENLWWCYNCIQIMDEARKYARKGIDPIGQLRKLVRLATLATQSSDFDNTMPESIKQPLSDMMDAIV
jgi:hypothetical protein